MRSGRVLGLLVIALSVPLGTTLVLTACSSDEAATGVSPAASSATSSACPTAASVVSDARLFADLTRAIRSAEPSLSPEELDAHILAVSGAPISMIVAPYDQSAESESTSFARTLVATSGTDASLTTDLEGIIHDSKGRPFHTVKEVTSLGKALFLSGHSLKVGGRDGYVLVAAPAE